MSQNESKKLAPELVITAALLYGLWALMISPMRENLNEAQAAHANVIEHTRIAGDPDLSTPRLEMVLKAIDGAIEDIEHRSDIARDQTALQARLMEIGDHSQVRIERMNPAKTRGMSNGDADDSVVSFEIECSGLYRDIAGFIAEIEENIGLTRIDRVSIRPDHNVEGAAVRARLRTMHYAFDTTPPPPVDPAPGMVGGAH